MGPLPQRVLELVAVGAGGAFAGAMATRERFDLVGALCLGIVAGVGGGLTRDVLLGVSPVALHDGWMVATAAVAAGITYLLGFGRLHTWVGVPLDAIGLGLFAVIGSQRARDAGLAWWAVVGIGVLNAVGGGVWRDVLCRRKPLVFQRDLVVVPSTIAAAAYLTLAPDVMRASAATAIVVGAVVVMRIVITQMRWHAWRSFPDEVALSEAFGDT